MKHEVRVDRLKLHTSGSNPIALKLGVQHALQHLRLPPSLLPPGAVLVIRRLADLPPLGPQTTERLLWQRRLHERLTTLIQHAIYPGRQYVPPDANCVLFVDEVDLLDCYTQDVVARQIHWYWRELFSIQPGQAVGDQLVTGWTRYPEALPAALTHISPQAVRQAMAGLTPQHAIRLIYQLHETFNLPPDVLIVHPSGGSVSNGLGKPMTAEPTPTTWPPTETSPLFPAKFQTDAAPWHAWLPDALKQQLTPPAEYILGLCYTLNRQPQWARHPHFAHQAAKWLAQVNVRQSRPHKPLIDSAPNQPQPDAGPQRVTASEAAAPLQPAPKPDLIAVSPFQDGINTQLGGVLFLINLFTRWQLPDALDDLASLSPWALLAAVAADLLGERYGLYRVDPLWDSLSELAGLPPAARWGADLDPPPADAKQRLQAYLATIGLTLDPAVGDIATEPLDPHLREQVASSLAAWVAYLRPYIRAWLRQVAAASARPIESLLTKPATLYLTRTHIDLVMSVETIDLDLRRAGLDRNPGWLPAYSYIISFHFE